MSIFDSLFGNNKRKKAEEAEDYTGYVSPEVEDAFRNPVQGVNDAPGIGDDILKMPSRPTSTGWQDILGGAFQGVSNYYGVGDAYKAAYTQAAQRREQEFQEQMNKYRVALDQRKENAALAQKNREMSQKDRANDIALLKVAQAFQNAQRQKDLARQEEERTKAKADAAVAAAKVQTYDDAVTLFNEVAKDGTFNGTLLSPEQIMTFTVALGEKREYLRKSEKQDARADQSDQWRVEDRQYEQAKDWIDARVSNYGALVANGDPESSENINMARDMLVDSFNSLPEGALKNRIVSYTMSEFNKLATQVGKEQKKKIDAADNAFESFILDPKKKANLDRKIKESSANDAASFASNESGFGVFSKSQAFHDYVDSEIVKNDVREQSKSELKKAYPFAGEDEIDLLHKHASRPGVFRVDLAQMEEDGKGVEEHNKYIDKSFSPHYAIAYEADSIRKDLSEIAAYLQKNPEDLKGKSIFEIEKELRQALFSAGKAGPVLGFQSGDLTIGNIEAPKGISDKVWKVIDNVEKLRKVVRGAYTKPENPYKIDMSKINKARPGVDMESLVLSDIIEKVAANELNFEARRKKIDQEKIEQDFEKARSLVQDNPLDWE